MSSMNAQSSVVMLFVVGALLGIAWVNPVPEHRAEAAQEKPAKLEKYYYGEEMCSQCHNMTAAEAKKKVPEDKALLYRGIEMDTWVAKDKHKNATQVLFDERAQLMEKNLRYKVAESAQCLSCHGVHVKHESEADPDTFKLKQRIESGVTCVACHGEFADWVNEHSKPAKSKWKQYTMKDKQNWGMKDLWDTETRAALCSSCHVGSVKLGRIVTHEMYAAGHPPLPGIEVATFCDALPRHWETLTEKVQKRGRQILVLGERKMTFAEFYREKHDFNPGEKLDENLEQTRTVAISAVGGFKMSMELIAGQAAKHTEKPESWPEFAMYDCYACHHDLKSDSWRLERPNSGVPGRPGARAWSATLLPLVMSHAHGDQKVLADKLKTLDFAYSNTPFGQPDEIAKSSRDLANWSKSLLKKLQASPFTKANSAKLLNGMFDRAAGTSLDFDSARQLAWGAKALFGELHPQALYGKSDPKIGGPPVELNDGPFNELNKMLSLRLPQGQVPIVGEFLTETLDRMRKYEPKDFRAEMKKIANSVKQD
jgi:nitrate/TMAO reductase-like tetraheme cytochrome c subunit